MDILFPSLFFFIGLAALSAGLVLLVRPNAASRLNLPLRRAVPAIAVSIRLERFYYRHHRITGPITAAGGLLLVLIALYLPGIGFFASSRPDTYPVLRDTVAIFAAISGPGIFLFGLGVLIRPSALKRFEATANQPVTRETISAFFRRLRSGIACFTETHPRIVGLFAAASGIVFLAICFVI